MTYDDRKHLEKNLSFYIWLECLPMVREIWIQFQVESYQRLKNGT